MRVIWIAFSLASVHANAVEERLCFMDEQVSFHEMNGHEVEKSKTPSISESSSGRVIPCREVEHEHRVYVQCGLKATKLQHAAHNL